MLARLVALWLKWLATILFEDLEELLGGWEEFLNSLRVGHSVVRLALRGRATTWLQLSELVLMWQRLVLLS